MSRWPTDMPAGGTYRQRDIAALLVSPDESGLPRTYYQVAFALGLHIGTVHRQLYRLRKADEAFYAYVMAERGKLMEHRHRESVEAHRLWLIGYNRNYRAAHKETA